MGFNGSIGVHIKTGRRHMAEDHFRTLLDPPKGYERSKNPKEPTKLLELSRPQYVNIHGLHKKTDRALYVTH